MPSAGTSPSPSRGSNQSLGALGRQQGRPAPAPDISGGHVRTEVSLGCCCMCLGRLVDGRVCSLVDKYLDEKVFFGNKKGIAGNGAKARDADVCEHFVQVV